VSLADLAEEYSVGRSAIHRVIHRNPCPRAPNRRRQPRTDQLSSDSS
jgi:hypothetical protein